MRQYTAVLGDLPGDQFQNINDQLGEVIRAAMATGKPGSLTVKLKITPAGVNSVQLGCDVKSSVPVKPIPPSIFFVVNEDSLVRNNPDQGQLPLKAVDTPAAAAPLKDAGISTAPAPLKTATA
jgi:hypothetical protein